MSFEISSVVVGSAVLVISIVICDGIVTSDCCTVFVSISSIGSVVRSVVFSGCCMVFASIFSDDLSFIADTVVASGVTVTLSVIGVGVVSRMSLAACKF